MLEFGKKHAKNFLDIALNDKNKKITRKKHIKIFIYKTCKSDKIRYCSNSLSIILSFNFSTSIKNNKLLIRVCFIKNKIYISNTYYFYNIFYI